MATQTSPICLTVVIQKPPVQISTGQCDVLIQVNQTVTITDNKAQLATGYSAIQEMMLLWDTLLPAGPLLAN
jgi:hypothetical protein